MLRKLSPGMVALCMAAGLSMVACPGGDDDPVCGDGVMEGSEVCDGSQLGGATCADEGFSGGVLNCNASCDGFDTSMCTDDICGDGNITGMEDCDGANLDMTTCEDLNFDGGTLACNQCTFDTSACYDNCGDGAIQAGDEVCDGAELGGDDCTDHNFDGGQLACAADCSAFDTAGCCADNCTAADDTQCTGDVLNTCTLGSNGCLDWVDTDCTATSEVCSGTPAACTGSCTSDCPAIDDTQCADATNLETCTDSGNGCMNWVASPCTGGFCSGDPSMCITTGTGLGCADVYNLDGRTFPHELTGIWATGAFTFSGSCQNGEHPIYLSYTVQATGLTELYFDAAETATAAYPQVSAWTTTEATGFCDPAQMTELGCEYNYNTLRLTLDGSGLNQGDVVYFLLSGDGASYELNDPSVSITEIVCGDGVIAGSEACDDGNSATGDGCDDTCQIEATYWCTGEPSLCMVPTCGDGYMNDSAEECDDGNTGTGDGCDGSCLIEATYWCIGQPSVCMVPTCGDGYANAAGEQCDDGNTTINDGCDNSCQFELFACPAGETHVTVVSTDVPHTLDYWAWDVYSEATVTATGMVTRAQVTLTDIQHTYDGDLDIWIGSPASNWVTLSNYNGSSGANYINTVFDDACSTLGNGDISSGTAPFTGCYAPDGALSDLMGEQAAGTWYLNVFDADNYYDDGVLNGWTLELCVRP